MNKDTVSVPLVVRVDAKGNVTYERVEIPVTTYEQWLKKCFDLS